MQTCTFVNFISQLFLTTFPANFQNKSTVLPLNGKSSSVTSGGQRAIIGNSFFLQLNIYMCSMVFFIFSFFEDFFISIWQNLGTPLTILAKSGHSPQKIGKIWAPPPPSQTNGKSGGCPPQHPTPHTTTFPVFNSQFSE